MSEVYIIITITSRAKLPDFLAAYDENNMPIGFISLGYGTAKDEILDMLGLDRSEKAVGMGVITGEVWKETKRYLRKKMYIDMPDTGISFIIPMSSIGGKRELAFLISGQDYQKGEESVMKDTTMEFRGTGMNQAELFFGVSLASEKDMTFIVTKKSQRNAIMSAIMKNAGMDTPAQSIVFSLPVTDVAGINMGDDNEE